MTDPHQMLDLWLEKVEDAELKRELEDLKRSGDEPRSQMRSSRTSRLALQVCEGS